MLPQHKIIKYNDPASINTGNVPDWPNIYNESNEALNAAPLMSRAFRRSSGAPTWLLCPHIQCAAGDKLLAIMMVPIDCAILRASC